MGICQAWLAGFGILKLNGEKSPELPPTIFFFPERLDF
jgi:hypothetical protein